MSIASPDTPPMITPDIAARLTGRELAAVEHCDITDIHPTVLALLNAEVIMTRHDLATLLLDAQSDVRTLATSFILDTLQRR